MKKNRVKARQYCYVEDEVEPKTCENGDRGSGSVMCMVYYQEDIHTQVSLQFKSSEQRSLHVGDNHGQMLGTSFPVSA